MTIQEYLALCLVCLLGAASPGPSLAVILGATLGTSPAAGLRAALAHGAGVAVYAALTVSGLALFLAQAPTLYALVQIAGALYLLYLGARALLASRSSSAPATPEVQSQRSGRDGFMIAFLNPKLALFMLALFSQFLGQDAGIGQKVLMVITAGGIDAGWYAVVVYLCSRGPLIGALERHRVSIDRFFGLLLISLAALVILRATLPHPS